MAVSYWQCEVLSIILSSHTFVLLSRAAWSHKFSPNVCNIRIAMIIYIAIHSMCILLYIYFNVFILPFGFIVCISYTYCACLGVAAVLIHKSSLDNMHMWHVKYMYMVHTQIFVYNTDNISNYFLTMDFAFKILPLRLC